MVATTVRICLLVASFSLALARVAVAAAPAEEPPPSCAAPAGDRPPDPRCGEPLDGRTPATTPAPAGVTAERDALWLPKEASLVALWPLVHGTDYLEYHHVPGWYQAILTSDDGKVGIRPELSYSTSFAPTVGARFFDRRLPGEGAEILGEARHRRSAGAVRRARAARPLRLGLTFGVAFDHRLDRLFAGIGPNSSASLAAAGLGFARFGSDNVRAEARWLGRLPARLRAVVHADVQRRDYEADDVRRGPTVADVYGLPPADCAALGLASPCVNQAYMPGFYQGLRIVHGGVGLALDARSRLRGGSGVSALVDATSGWGVAGDPSRELRLSAETVAALAGIDRALLFRAWAATIQPLGSSALSFDELISPCGDLGMRGFPDGRFRGESGAVGTVEYRYYISWNMDASVFSDVGTVAGPGFSGIGSEPLVPRRRRRGPLLRPERAALGGGAEDRRPDRLLARRWFPPASGPRRILTRRPRSGRDVMGSC